MERVVDNRMEKTKRKKEKSEGMKKKLGGALRCIQLSKFPIWRFRINFFDSVFKSLSLFHRLGHIKKVYMCKILLNIYNR